MCFQDMSNHTSPQLCAFWSFTLPFCTHFTIQLLSHSLLQCSASVKFSRFLSSSCPRDFSSNKQQRGARVSQPEGRVMLDQISTGVIRSCSLGSSNSKFIKSSGLLHAQQNSEVLGKPCFFYCCFNDNQSSEKIHSSETITRRQSTIKGILLLGK